MLMMKMTRAHAVQAIGLLTAAATVSLPEPARADSQLLQLQVGQSVTFRINSQSDGGQSQKQDDVRFARVSPTVFNVSANGSPPVPIEISAGGTLTAPASLDRVLAPFKQIALVMHGAPTPLESYSSWVVDMPVPVDKKGQVDNVPLVVNVTRFGAGGATVHASGENAASGRSRLRRVEDNVGANITINFGRAGVSDAQGSIGVDVHRGVVSKAFDNSWTLSRINS